MHLQAAKSGDFAPQVPWTGPGLCAREEVCRKYLGPKNPLRFALLSNGLSEDLGPVKLQRISSAQSAVPKPKGDANIQSVADWTEELLL